jgi:hypothetical protein
MDEDHP